MSKVDIPAQAPSVQEQSIATSDSQLACELPSEKNPHSIKASSESDLKGKSTNFGGIVNMFKGYVGSGVLALPYVFNEAGYLYGAIFIVVLGLVVYYTNVLLLKVGDRLLKKGESYIDVCDKLLDYRLAFFMRICFIVGALSGCISYVLIFVEFFTVAIGDSMSKYVYLLFSLIIILPMSLINDFSRFVKYSFLANSMLFLAIGTMYVQNFYDIFTTDAFSENVDNVVNFEKGPLMIGVGLYAFDAIYFILDMKNSLRQPESFTTRVLNVTNLIVAVLYLTFGFTGVWANGHDMEEIYLFSLPDNVFSRILQLLYAVAIAFSYPLFLHAACSILEKNDNCVGKMINSGDSDKKIVVKRTAFRSFMTCIVIVVAFLIPRFAIALNLFGSISGASLQFFLPLYSYYAVFKNEMSTPLKIFNHMVLIIGLGGCVWGIYGSIDEIVNGSE